MIFKDYAQRYFESNLSVIPVSGKKPRLNEWSKFCKSMPTDEQIDEWMGKFSKSGISLCCGPASGILAFDIDTEDEKIVAIIDKYLPKSPFGKRGQKGFTYFYKYSGQRLRSLNINNERVVDVLGDGRHTVLPPSIHPDTGFEYKWVGKELIDFSDELPDLDESIIDKIFNDLKKYDKSLVNNVIKNNKLISGRNDALVKFVASIYDVLPPHDCIKKLISFDASNNTPPLFLDESEGNDPKNLYENAERFYHSVGKTILNEKKRRGETETKDNELSIEQEKYNEFFKTGLYLKGPLKDILTEKIFYSHPLDSHRWVTGDELMPVIRSYGKSKGLASAQIQTEFQRFELEHQKLDFLVDIPDWDGVDHLLKLTDCLVSDKFTTDELHEIFLYWGHGIFRRIYEDDYQNECIILKGGQGIGKDNWVKSLVKGFGPYYEGIEVQDIGEMVPAVQRIYVAHLEEFDQTRKIDVSELKALITKPTSFFREKYARTASRKPMKASWISTVNVDDIFRDPTGNRRFIVIPLLSIAWAYPTNISINVLSQFKATKPFELSDNTQNKIDQIIKAMTPDDTAEYLDELVKDELQQAFKLSANAERLPYKDVAERWLKIARLQQVSVRRVQSVAKKYQINSAGKWYVREKLADY